MNYEKDLLIDCRRMVAEAIRIVCNCTYASANTDGICIRGPQAHHMIQDLGPVSDYINALTR
jgi:hypothetical protein